MISNFSEEAQNVLNKAKEETSKLKHPYIGTEHLILSILSIDNNVKERLKDYNINYDIYREELINIAPVGNKEINDYTYTPLLRKVIESSSYITRENNIPEVTVNTLIASLLEIGEGTGIRVLVSMGVDINKLYNEFNTISVKRNKKKLMVTDFGVCLNDLARDGKLDPVIGREKEVTRVLEILCRKSKNNPVLVGEAGVGKSAIAEEVARRIELEMVPDRLLGKRIISISMANLVAGTKYRGEFEDRMKKLIKEVEEEDDIILFIDEVHTLVGAGGAEGAIDASNILKPALARGNIRCIGATTIGEYKKSIRTDSALERRFQVVRVNEPSIEETKEILGGIRDIYERYHNVVISDEIVEFIVESADRYIVGRYFPDKAIDVMDEVCAMVCSRGDEKRKVITDLRGRINRVRRDKNCCILDNRLEEAYDMLREEKRLMYEVDVLSLNGKRGKSVIGKDDVKGVIEDIAGVRIFDRSGMVEGMEFIRRSIDSGMVVSEGIKREIERIVWGKCYGIGSMRRVYLFAGPTGVGKTMSASLIGKMLGNGNGDNVIRVDMSEFSDSSSVSKVIGSNPGYVGYDDNGSVVERVRSNPSGVILLDEVDKAHSSVMGLFYQIMDEGVIRDGKGDVVRINNVIIMTTNVGYEKDGVGFEVDKRSECNGELRRVFGDAFMNRIDRVICFDRLKEEDIREIIEREVSGFSRELDMDIVMNDEDIRGIICDSEYEVYGARRVKKLVRDRMERLMEECYCNRKKCKEGVLGKKTVV